MKSFKFIFLAFILGIFVTQTSANDGWVEIYSDNFHLIGKVDAAEMREICKKLEKFQLIISLSFPKIKIKTPFKTNIIVVKNNSSFEIAKLKYNSKSSNKYFISSNDANYGIISVEKTESAEQVFEGYAKFLVENNIGRNNLPTWVFEGLGEYFKSISFNDEQNFEFGMLPNNVAILQQNKLIPLNVLLETDNFTLQNQDENRKKLFRAQSWALLQFLLKDSENLTKLQSFIELRQQGIEAKRTLIEVFQLSVSKLSEDLPKFIQQNNFKSQKGKLADSPTLQIAQTTESQWLAVLADYHYYAENFAESELLTKKSLKLEPHQTLALTTLALIKAKDFYYDEAEKLAEKAVETEPNNFLNHYRLAVVLSRRGMTEFGFVSGYNGSLANQMRESLNKAIELNPFFIESYALLAFINYVRNEKLDESIRLINRALQIAIGNHQYQLRLAELSLRKESFFEARKIALQVLQNTPFEGVKLYAQNTVQRIDTTEYQLERIRNQKTKYVDDDIISENPLSDDEIRKLREKATNDQIKAVLRRPKVDEKRIFGNLRKIECEKNKVDFIIATPTGLLKLQTNSIDGINLLSLVAEMSDYRLGCGTIVRENNASIIFKADSLKMGEIISIEFVPKGFKF